MGNKRKVIEIVGNIIFVIIIAVILISAVLFSNSDRGDKSIFGYRFYTVLTPSMTPTIPVGSMIFVHMVEPEKLEVGDIITYATTSDGKVVVTHRVNEILKSDDKLEFITKGDANDVTDLNPVSSSQVIGKVNLFIPYLGSIMEYVQRNLSLVIISIIAIVLILELISFLIARNKKTNKE